jgi:cytochrome bd-type quinol oxidase subunit 2
MRKIIGFVSSLALLALPAIVAAANGGTFNTDTLKTTIDGLKGVVNTLLVVLSGVAVIVFIWGIIKYVLASNDGEKRKEARNYMIYGVVAFAVIVGLFGLSNAVLSFVGLKEVDNSFNVPQIGQE